MEYRHINIVNLINTFLAIVLFNMAIGDLKFELFIVLFITSIIMVYMKEGYKSLLIGILSVLIVGIFIVGIMIVKPEYLAFQVETVIIFMIYAFLQFLLWYTIQGITKGGIELLSLRTKIYKREGLGEEKSILSLEEFKVRKEFIENISQRSGEEIRTLYIHITVPKRRSFYKSVVETVGYSLGTVLRSNYDLISKLNENTFIVLLQNANDRGVKRVRERFLDKLSSYIKDAEDYIQIVELHQEGAK